MTSLVLIFAMSLGFGSGVDVGDVWEQMGELPSDSSMALSVAEFYLDYDKLEAIMGNDLDMLAEELPPQLQEYSVEELFDLARFEVRANLLASENSDGYNDPQLFLAVRPLIDEAKQLMLSILETAPRNTVGDIEVWDLDGMMVSYDGDWFYLGDSPDSLHRGMSTPLEQLQSTELYADSTANLPGASKLALWVDLNQLIEGDGSDECLENPDGYPDNKGNEPESAGFEEQLTSLALAITEEQLLLRLGLSKDEPLPEEYQRFSKLTGYPTLAELVPESCLAFGDAWIDNPLLYLVETIASKEESEGLEIREADTEELGSLQTGELAISLHAVQGTPRNNLVEALLDETIDLDFEHYDPRMMFYFGSKRSAELLTTLTDLLLAVAPDAPERSNQLFGSLTAEVWGIEDGDIYLFPVDEALVICVGESSAEMFAAGYGGAGNLSSEEEFLTSQAIPTEPVSISLFLRLDELITAGTEDDGYSSVPALLQNSAETVGLTAKLTESQIEVISNAELLDLALTSVVLGTLPFTGQVEVDSEQPY